MNVDQSNQPRISASFHASTSVRSPAEPLPTRGARVALEVAEPHHESIASAQQTGRSSHETSWDHPVAKRAAKRCLDIAGALLLLLVSLPLWVVAAIAIKFDSRGPIFFKQTRVGRGGRPFTIYKFRTMQTDADAQKTLYLDLNEADGPYFKLQSDPRVTRVGRVLRRFSVDELPQVLNVMFGTMSLVGPRPALPSEVCDYPHWVRRRLAVRPGLTGLWQVSGRFLLSFPHGANLDVSYVDEWSLALDLQILARTPRVVLSGHGAS